MLRVRSLSIQDREEALAESHLIPLITEKVMEQLISQLITDHLKEEVKTRRTRKKSPQKV